MTDGTILRVNGWTILVHPLFLDQIAALASEVKKARLKDEIGFRKKNSAKRLAAITTLAFEKIPQDPTNRVYFQGTTLGDEYKYWHRAKFFQQYRLFFRCDLASKIIIYGWVNDETTKRAYGSKVDAYSVFRRMLASGKPPDDWAALKSECEAETQRYSKGVLEEAASLLGDVDRPSD